jgi:hypothetical protein
MNREELTQRARLAFEWAPLFDSLGFRKSRTEEAKDGAKIAVWNRSTSQGEVEFWTHSEDGPAYLSNGVDSPKAKWEKLDVILTLHAGGDWSLLEHLVTAADLVVTGPLQEIARETRAHSQDLESGASLEERLDQDPLFRAQYQKSLRELSARKAAEETLANSNSPGLTNLPGLSAEQLSEKTGWINWARLWSDETPERWFVPNLLCEGRAHGCPAPSGIGKSLLWQDVAAGLASGRSVLGYPAKEPIRVLYLDHENTPKGDIKPRLKAMGYEPDDLENLIYLSFPSLQSLNTKAGGMSLVELLDFFQPQLVFIDTFSRFVEGDENSSRVAQEFYDYSGRELKRRNIAYLRIDHVGKDASRGARGSSAKVDDLDLIWTMSKSKEDGVFIMKNDKARVPIKTSELAIERRESPLRHLVRSGIRWDELIATARKHEDAIALVEGLKASEPAHSLAQGKVWQSLKTECASKGIGRRQLYQALAFVKGEVDSLDFI